MSLENTSLLETLCVQAEDYPWVSGSFGGASMRMLSLAADSGTWVVQTRMPPGLASPTHRHTGCVYAFTMSGRWGYREYDWWAKPGSFVHEPAGVVHTLVIPEDNSEMAEVIYVVEGGNINFDADGTFLYYEDGHGMRDFYVSACREQGYDPPARFIGDRQAGIL
ncbi:MAG: 2,4'-dihydroxyacetophenone dioxygenase family protein [Actinobacteria bacterium]|nr:2,4'-dihydroxyacetophenone dioxygenase family protein [Actinomycetota bacterium]